MKLNKMELNIIYNAVVEYEDDYSMSESKEWKTTTHDLINKLKIELRKIHKDERANIPYKDLPVEKQVEFRKMMKQDYYIAIIFAVLVGLMVLINIVVFFMRY